MTEQKQSNVMAPANGGAVTSAPKKVDVLKGVLNAPSVMEQFKNALAKNAPTFVASVIDLYNNDSGLQECEPKQVVMEALKAAVLHLPINKALGYAYIIAFNNKKKIRDEHGIERTVKVKEPTFQIGYKGYIQLAMRTGQYRTLNADVVYEGEVRKVSKLTGEIAFDGEKKSDKVVGYFCYFELLNGFSKTLYMTVEQMAAHAKRYAKGLKSETTIEQLLAAAARPITEVSVVGWLGNFHAMGLKTVIRNLLSHYGYLSTEMLNAFSQDMKDEELADAREVQDPSKVIMLDGDSVQVVGKNTATEQAEPEIPMPEY